MLRTHTCGELRLSDVNKEVKLSGWVQRSRDLGGMTFVDLRDRYGLTQLAFNEEDNKELTEKARKLGREFVIQITGKVIERTSKNKNIPTGEVENRPFEIKKGKAFGPGVADMKPGLVMNAFILAAFAKFGGQPNPMVGLFTGDEEIGSPASQDIIVAEAKKARLAFNSEPGRPSGNIVTKRKGGIFCHCSVSGVAAHSGGAFEEGRSAIEELARKIQSLHALTELDRGITINVGLISGGQSVNTFAAEANCDIDIRYRAEEDRDEIIDNVKKICEITTVDGTSSSLRVKGEFHPLNPSTESMELFDIYCEVATEDGVQIEGEHSGGCADSGFIAAAGTPVICGVGPVGGNYHRPDEWMELKSLSERACFIAKTIQTLTSRATKTSL